VFAVGKGSGDKDHKVNKIAVYLTASDTIIVSFVKEKGMMGVS
jgi:hypothetical protein